MKRPSKTQVTALAWAVYKGHGFARDLEFDHLGFRDATVASLESARWADRVKFFDDVRKWRWQWFWVTESGAALPEVVAEVARLRAADDERARRNFEEDDEYVAGKTGSA